MKSVPQAGDDAVDPGLTDIRVTFSADMQDGNWNWVQIDPELFPESGDASFESARVNVLHDVVLDPDHTYVIWLNLPPYDSFIDLHGNRAVAYQLAFHTAPE